MRQIGVWSGVGVLAMLMPVGGAAAVDFHLLSWGEAQATEALPSMAGLKPARAGEPGDWLLSTADDERQDVANNLHGAFSHNFADLTGGTASAFNMAPSLTGTLSLTFTPAANGGENVAVTQLNYSGQANSMLYMNQFLVTAESAAAQDSLYKVDGIGNDGTWSGAGTWEIQYHVDFHLATNADGNPLPADIDVAFNDTLHRGYLVPVAQLTAGLHLDDPAGFYAGNFSNYLLEEVLPRLPDDATYLLVTQMSKTHPVYAEAGLPFTTSLTVGNTTIAYTTVAIPEPSTMAGLVAAGCLLCRRGRSSALRGREGA